MPGDDIIQNNPMSANQRTLVDRAIEKIIYKTPFLIGKINGLGYLAEKDSDFRTSKFIFDNDPNTLISNLNEDQKRDMINQIDQWFKDPNNQAEIKNGLSTIAKRAIPDITGALLFKRIAEIQAEYIQTMNDVISGKFNSQPVNPNPQPVQQQVLFQSNAPIGDTGVKNPFVQKYSRDMGLHLLDLNKYDPDFVKEISNFSDNTDPEIANLYADIMNVSTMPRDMLFDEGDIQDDIGSTYDGRVKDIYKKMNDIIKKHPQEMSDKNSSVYKIAQFKAKHFDQGSLKDELTEDSIIVDATGKSGTNLNSVHNSKNVSFDGDQLEKCVENIRFRDIAPFSYTGQTVVMKDRRNEPLFTREPHFSDIKQGNVGSCYFVAYMSSLAKSNPQAIKDMMRDNNDGTVTCKFYDGPKPIYVTVNKTVPHVVDYNGKTHPVNGENNPLWLDIVEKAYKMSGLKPYGRFAPDNRENYQLFLNNYKKSKSNPYMSDRDAEMGLFRDCYGPNTPFNEILYSRLLNSSNLALNLGTAYQVMENLSGRRATQNVINTIRPDEFYASFNNGQTGPVLSDTENNLDPWQKAIVDAMKFYVAQDLKNNKFSRRFALEGGLERAEYVRYSAVTVEDITEGFANVVDNYKYQLNQQFPYVTDDQLRNIANNYAVSVYNYHKFGNGTRNLAFRMQGMYTKYSENLYDEIARHIDKSGFVQVGMGGHAFSVLNTEERDGKKYITLRNPWNKTGLVGNHNVRDLGPGGSEFKGVFEMELNEFVSKVENYVLLDRKILTMDAIRTLATNQYIDIFAERFQQKLPEDFINKCKNDPEIFNIIKNCPEVKSVTALSSESIAMAKAYETEGRISLDWFDQASNMTNESMQALYNKILPKLQPPVRQQAEPVQIKAEPVKPEPAPVQVQPAPAPAPKQPELEQSLGEMLKQGMDSLSLIVKDDDKFSPVQKLLNSLTVSGKYTGKDLKKIKQAYELLETYQEDLEKQAQEGLECDEDIANLSRIMVTLDNMELEAKNVLSAVGDNKLGHNMSVLGTAGKKAKTPQEALMALKLTSGKNLKYLASADLSEIKQEYATIMVCDKYLKAIEQGKTPDIQNFDKDVTELLADDKLMTGVLGKPNIEIERLKFMNVKSSEEFNTAMTNLSNMLDNERRSIAPDNKLDNRFEELQNNIPQDQGFVMG